MNLSEKAAYLKGLADGMSIGAETNQDKLLRGILDLLEGLSNTVDTMDCEIDGICDELDTIEGDLYDEDLYDGDDEEEDDGEDEDEAEYELTCPACGAVTVVDESMLEDEELCCPACGAHFEIIVEEEGGEAAPDAAPEEDPLG